MNINDEEKSWTIFDDVVLKVLHEMEKIIYDIKYDHGHYIITENGEFHSSYDTYGEAKRELELLTC